MTILANISLNEIQQKHAAVKLAITFKRDATNEARYIARQALVEREVVGRNIRMAPRLRQSFTPDFATPAKRKKEYRSTTGLRSFHFGFSSVTKSSKPRGEPGTKVYANAAANNVIYIEDGAVAHDGHTAYIDGSRVETVPNGDRYAPSNISTFYPERVEFFELVEEFERDNHGDKATIDFSVNTAMWAAVAADPECDLTVVHAYQTYRTSNNCNRQKISLIGSGAELRDVMTKHGFVVDNPIPHKERIVRDGFCFHDGRGGRVQYRLVFELPREFNSEQRRQALQVLCDRIGGDGCMYVGVIHAPDSHNDDNNYHIHLDFYDRKCRRLGENVDNLINVKDHLKPIIAKDIANEVYKKEIDEEAWDFTVKREYQSNKKKKTHRPFAAAHKSDALRSKDYVKTVRERFAEDVNSIAVAAGMSKIYDPRDYAAMGVNAPATKKLGQKQHALEVKGVATKVGIDNETVQTDFEMSMIERAHQDTSRHLDEVQFYWQSVSHKSPPQLDAAKLAVDTEMDKARMANDIRRDLDYLALEQERERSRANLVSQRQWKISKSASASAADVLRSAELEKAADAYIAKLDQQDKALTGNIAELEIFAAAFGAKQLERAIAEFGLKMDALGLERHGQPSADKSLPAKRSIIVKAGILERLKDYRPPAPELDETVLPSTAIENVVQQAGAPLLPPTPEAPPADVSVVAIADITATSIPVADMEPVEVARAITAKTVPPLPTYVDSDRKDNTPRTGDCANILPCVTLKQIDDGDLIGVQSPDATKDVSANLPAQVQPDVEALLEPAHDLPLPTSEPPASLIDLGFDPSGGTSAMQRPTIDDTTGDKLAADSVHQPVDKPQNAVTDRPEGNRMSVLVENSAAPSDLTDQQGFSPAQKLNGPTVIHDRIEQSVGLVDQMSGRHDAASGAVNSKTQHVKDETRTSSGIVNNPDADNNVDRPIIASDFKNTDTKRLAAITQAPANQTHHMQLPTQISSAEDDLDPVTAYKVLWMYRDIDFKAQKSPMHPENRLYDKAMAHPQSNELLSALARRIGNKGDAAKVAIVPSAKLDKPLTQVPQSLPGTDNIVEQSSAEPESRVALARTVPSSVKSLDDPDKSVAAQPSIKDGAIKDNSKFDSAQARVAIPPPRADEHESLIHRFLTARDDKERRIAAGLIRADKTALERMAQRNDPRWIAFDRQFRIQQHTAGRDRGGIGW